MPPLIPTTRTGSAHSEAVLSEVMKACEVVVSEVMEVSEVVMMPKVTKVIHRVGGQRRWRGKHRHHDSTSDRCFAEHDNPPDCPRAIVRTQCKMFK
jgi:hypothetical protein